MIYIKENWRIWYIGFLIRKQDKVWLKMKCKLKNYINQWWKDLKKKSVYKVRRLVLGSRFSRNIIIFFNCGGKYLLCLIDLFTTYSWVKPLADKKSKTVPDGFIEIVNQSKLKPNKLYIVLGREFYSNFMQSWLGDNDILLYSTYNEYKSVAADRFVRNLKGKIYKK